MIRPRRFRRPRRDRGSAMVEFAAFLPLLLLAVVVAFEALLAFVAIERLDDAARNAARTAGSQGIAGGEAHAHSSVPDWIELETVHVSAADEGGFTARVESQMPFLFPASEVGLTLNREVHMPNV